MDNTIMALGVTQLGFTRRIRRRHVENTLQTIWSAAELNASFGKYMDPFNNLLFFASWPMLMRVSQSSYCVTTTLIACPTNTKGAGRWRPI
ncbi:hypothetical protein O9992_27005 [Vibrio lentus]|nr:hypothetical protein [Vibrio lentus]